MASFPNLGSISLDGYNLVGQIGSGSYSTVFKAVDKSTKEIVAVKCVDKTKLSNSGKDNIIMEITVMKLLQHKYIVQMKDFKWDDRFIFIILEFCDGGDLSKFIKRQKLPEKICKKFMQQLALGLQFLRSKNICHWDLKPSNLLLVTKPALTLKIGDFGFAGFLSSEAKKVSFRGSPMYMAPEMLLGEDFDIKADLWSVGVIMFESLFGKPPLAHSNCRQLIITIRNKTPIEIPKSEVSSDCFDLISKLLVYDPRNRITYEEFFSHKFIDLEHFPTEESYLKAVKIAREAVKLDSEKKYHEAFNTYCSALSYLIPFLNQPLEEGNTAKIKIKIDEYSKRAEAIKVLLYKAKEALVTAPDAKSESSYGSVQSVSSTVDIDETVIDVKALKTLCYNTPKLYDALDIGYSAQMYIYEGRYDLAADKFKSCFSAITPLLSEEPEGKRKKMLSKQVQEWLMHAENAKALLEAKDEENSALITTPPYESCVIQ